MLSVMASPLEECCQCRKACKFNTVYVFPRHVLQTALDLKKKADASREEDNVKAEEVYAPL